MGVSKPVIRFIMKIHINTKYQNYLIFSILILLTACSKQPIYKSNRVEGPSVVGGALKEWAIPLNYDEKRKMEYGIGNDERYLYINLQIKDTELGNKIFMTGLTLWIDTVGEMRKMYGIEYPMGLRKMMDDRQISPDRIPGEQGRPGRPDIQRIPEEMKIIGFTKRGASQLADPKGTPGIHLSASRDWGGAFIYYARISLDKILTNQSAFLADTTRVLSIGFETGRIDMPNIAGGSPGMPGGSGMPGGRAGGGRRPGGGTTEPSQRMGNMSQSTRLWIPKVRLTGL
jgi:hypothetical protein